jgi:hypothetical protein
MGKRVISGINNLWYLNIQILVKSSRQIGYSLVLKQVRFFSRRFFGNTGTAREVKKKSAIFAKFLHSYKMSSVKFVVIFCQNTKNKPFLPIAAADTKPCPRMGCLRSRAATTASERRRLLTPGAEDTPWHRSRGRSNSSSSNSSTTSIWRMAWGRFG